MMETGEITMRLERMAKHAVYTPGEKGFSLSLDDGIALKEAAEALKKANMLLTKISEPTEEERMTEEDEKTINEMIGYFLPCWHNAAQGSEAKKRFARFIDTLMRLSTGDGEEAGEDGRADKAGL